MTEIRINPLHQLAALGQSIWLDSLGRQLLDSGELAHLIEHDAVTGITSNPAIFEKAINGTGVYDADITHLARRGLDTADILHELMLGDIRAAADLLRPVFERSAGVDGYVSLEVSPDLARDVEGTLAEARELWRRLERPNVMIKVPGTVEGLQALRELTREGINVNVTLLFSVARYAEVCEHWIAGLEDRQAAGEPVDHVASVASFFLSRIDSQVDPLLQAQGEKRQGYLGEAAIASAKLAFRHSRRAFAGPRWERLAKAGARPQRLLWASTSTKNPAYPDTKYVSTLIGAGTVNTMPLETLIAFRDHGKPADSLALGLDDAEALVQSLARLGIDLEAVAGQLEEDGLRKFVEPFDKLREAVEAKRRAVQGQQASG